MLGFRVWDHQLIVDKDEYKWVQVEFDPYQFGSYVSRIDLNYYWFAMNQSTGIKDRNGALIYEGDILEIDTVCLDENGANRQEKIIYQVDCSFIAAMDFERMQCVSFIGSDYKNKKFEAVISGKVIGNIYENEELLAKVNG